MMQCDQLDNPIGLNHPSATSLRLLHSRSLYACFVGRNHDGWPVNHAVCLPPNSTWPHRYTPIGSAFFRACKTLPVTFLVINQSDKASSYWLGNLSFRREAACFVIFLLVQSKPVSSRRKNFGLVGDDTRPTDCLSYGMQTDTFYSTVMGPRSTARAGKIFSKNFPAPCGSVTTTP